MVNNYEAGVRLNIGGIKASAAYFISTSKLGTDCVINPLAPATRIDASTRYDFGPVDVSLGYSKALRRTVFVQVGVDY